MPSRPRTHVIEEIAQAKFTLAVQPEWIVRIKDKDYGVDWEAERLGEDDSGTGDIFFVQSKATDAVEDAQSVQIKTDRLRYLASFEVPAMIVRYCVSTDTTYWMWVNEALAQSKYDAATVKLKFGEQHLWHGATLDEIKRTIPIIRKIKRSDPRTAFSLVLPSDIPSSLSIELVRITSGLSSLFYFVDQRHNSGVPIVMAVSGNEITLSIERLASVKGEVDRDNFEDLSCGIYYLLAALLETLDQLSQSAAVANACLLDRRTIRNDDLAARAAIALLKNGRPDEATDLAIMNGLHSSQSFGHAMFRVFLASPLIPQVRAGEAADRFYKAAISACQDRGEGVGALRYSYANFLANKGRLSDALCAFNSARKDEPDYWNRSYYLSELGGVLFRCGRYQASAKAYQCAFVSDPTERMRFRLGDAQLCAGNFIASADAFQPLNGLGNSVGAEVRLKLALLSWAQSKGLRALNRHHELHTMREVALTREAFVDAFSAHLAITFMLNDDIDCWADAIFLAAVVGVPGLLEDVMLVSTKRTQLEGYSRFKEQRQDMLSRGSFIQIELDKIALACNEQVLHEQW